MFVCGEDYNENLIPKTLQVQRNYEFIIKSLPSIPHWSNCITLYLKVKTTISAHYDAFESFCAPVFCDFVRNYSCTVDGAVVTSFSILPNSAITVTDQL